MNHRKWAKIINTKAINLWFGVMKMGYMTESQKCKMNQYLSNAKRALDELPTKPNNKFNNENMNRIFGNLF